MRLHVKSDYGGRAAANRAPIVIAVVYVLVFTAVLAWWVKGDLEMGWIIGAPLLVAGACLIGLSTALLFRRIVPALIAAGASAILGIILALIAIQTPNTWPLDPPRALADAASKFSQDRAGVEAAASHAIGFPVEIMEAKVESQRGWISKEGFSFRFQRRAAAAAVVVSFAAGPIDSMTFDMFEQGGRWLPIARSARRVPGMTFRQQAFQARFPGVPLIEVGGQGPHVPGTLLLVRAARSETEWELVLFRVASQDKVLDEVLRFTRPAIVEAFGKEVALRRLGPVGAVFMHFQPSGSYPVLFLLGPEFRFFGKLNDAGHGSVSLMARLKDGRVTFETERAFTRPR